LKAPKKLGEFGKVLVRFASAQVFSNALRMLSGFLVVSLIDPELYGKFSGVGVYMGYVLLGNGGVINGLNRELPYALGKGNDEEARQMASSVYVLVILLSILASVIFLIFGLKYFVEGEVLMGWIFIAYSIMGGLHIMQKQFLPVLYRTNKDFDSLSKQNIFTGIGNLISVIFIWLFGIYGLIARGIVVAGYELVLLFKNKPYQLDMKFNLNHFKLLFKTGLPIFAVGQINPLWTTILNSLIFNIGGGLSFGLYALANITQGAIGVIPKAFGQVIYPRMSIMLGQGRSITYILKTNVKPLFFQFGLMLIIGILGAYMLPILVPILLPKYSGGIVAAQWMMFVPAVQSFGALNNIYNVVKKQKWYFVSLLSGALMGSLFILSDYTANGFRLAAFPQGLLIGTSIQQLLSLFFLRYIARG